MYILHKKAVHVDMNFVLYSDIAIHVHMNYNTAKPRETEVSNPKAYR